MRKRFPVIAWAGLVAACAATAAVGCGDDDAALQVEAPGTDAGGDGSRTVPARDSGGTDAPARTDTGASDAKPNDATTSDGEADADADVEDADAGAPDADAGADAGADAATPDADASTTPDADASAAPDADAGPPPACGETISGPLTSLFPSGAAVTGATIGYQPCGSTATAGAGTFAIGASSNVDGYVTVSGLGFRKTLSAELNHLNWVNDPPVPVRAVGTGIGPYDITRGHVVIEITAVKDGCQKGGNTFDVIGGHGDAVKKYVDAAGNDIGATTGTDGLVWISNLNPANKANITMASSVVGCFPRYGLSTGTMTLEAGAVTVLTIELSK